MKKLIVHITARDIKLGQKNIYDGQSCPIALALDRKTRQYHHVYWDSLHLNGKFVKLPESAIRFQKMVLNNHRVKPFKFTVEV